jgi:RNase P subunit RPR2
MQNRFCPKCSALLRVKGLVDSDERVYATWQYCERCGWDERSDMDARDTDRGNDYTSPCN